MHKYNNPFYEGDLCEFLRFQEEFFVLDLMSEEDMIQYVVYDLKGDALEWYHEYVEENSSDKWTDPDYWTEFVTEMCKKFEEPKLALHVFDEMPQLKIVDEQSLVGKIQSNAAIEDTTLIFILDNGTDSLHYSHASITVKSDSSISVEVISMVDGCYEVWFNVADSEEMFEEWLNYALSVGVIFVFDPGGSPEEVPSN